MDHEFAVRANAVERYVLGDLPRVEVEDFERHFFECSQCSEELRAVSVLTEDLRAVFSEESIGLVQTPRGATTGPVIERLPVEASAPAAAVRPVLTHSEIPWWRRPWTIGPAFAALAFAALAGYQTLVLADQKQANQVEGIASFPLYSAARGEETVIAPPKGPSVYVLQMDKVSDSEVPAYHGVVRDEAGAQRYSFDVKNPGPGRAISVKIQAAALKEGRYVLTLEGGGTATYPFTIRFE
jgi:hypothetical protein